MKLFDVFLVPGHVCHHRAGHDGQAPDALWAVKSCCASREADGAVFGGCVGDAFVVFLVVSWTFYFTQGSCFMIRSL